jgi:hypothetical protein
MRWNILIAAGALALLCPLRAHAEEGGDVGEEVRAFNQIRLLASISTFSGEKLVETGSIGRYRLGGGGLELDLERVFDFIGYMAHIEGFAAPDTDDLNFFRGEGGLTFGVASWQGTVPGGVLVTVGCGGDVGRYWFAEEGRFYPLARARVRLWPGPDVPIQLSYTALPVAVSGAGGHLQEHRIELATGWSLLTFGSRLGFTVANAGEPRHTFSQLEIGAFAGMGFYE